MTRFFVNPMILAAFVPLALVAALAVHAAWRRRRLLTTLGPVQRVGPGRARPVIAWTLALMLLAVGAAGPRWGFGPPPPVAPGRDVVLVVDLSRSMLAADVAPNRVGRAKQALASFVDAVARRGGHRLALVAFAGQAALVCPLTHDYDHVRGKLAELDAAQLPPALRGDGGASGTRIGAAVALAVGSLDPALQGAQDIVLASDGDDPANDDEWRLGLAVAREAGVPVHVVGIGDPDRDAAVPGDDGPLRFKGAEVRTRLRADALRELARRTGGEYVALRGTASLRDVFDGRIAGRPTREAVAGTLPQPVGRHAWFFATALALLASTMFQVRWRRTAAVGVVALAAASPAEDALRRGLTALDAGEPVAALVEFARSAERTPDPGLVAYNQGVAFSRLNRWREAELHFRRCLSDATDDRRARALYNLGVSLLQQSQGKLAGPLKQAVAVFEQSRPLADDALRPDVLHNLELAKTLLANVPPQTRPPEDTDAGPDVKPPTAAPAPVVSGDTAPGTADAKGQPAGPADGKQTPRPTDKASPGKGNLPPLPDTDALVELSPADAAEHLATAERRIAEARRTRLRATGPVRAASYPDW